MNSNTSVQTSGSWAAPADTPAAEPRLARPAPAPDLAVVVPAYNEHDNIGPLLETLTRVLGSIAWELIVVDDDSPDGTAALVRAIGARDARVRCIRRIARRGLAGACLEGILATQARFVVVMDADLQHDARLLVPMFERLRSGRADLVIGTRMPDELGGPGMSKLRWRISGLANAMARRLLRQPVSDPMSGFFMIDRGIVEALAPRLSTQGFKLLLDIVMTARGSLRIEELSYRFGARQRGESKLDARVGFDFLGLLVSKATGDVLSTRFLFFATVGALGLAVHFVALSFGMEIARLPFSTSQSLATVIAIAGNFVLHNALTYRDSRLSGWRYVTGLVRFYVVASIGAAANIGMSNWMFADNRTWWVAGLAGGFLGVVWNYTAASLFVWRIR
jgi:dolichol-phosphate mannosyltransferase